MERRPMFAAPDRHMLAETQKKREFMSVWVEPAVRSADFRFRNAKNHILAR